MLELFHSIASTCSQKVRLCLAEKNVREWASHPVDLASDEHLRPEFLAINPNGVVPALRVDGAVIVESTAICEYLDEAFTPMGSLSPASLVGRAQMRAWLRYIDEVPSMAVRVPTFQGWILPKYQRMTDGEFQAFKRANPLRRPFLSRIDRQSGFSAEDQEIARWQLEQSLQRMAKALAASPWICGERFGLVDICMLPLVVRLIDVGLGGLLDDVTAVRAWYDRAISRPSFDFAFPSGSRPFQAAVSC
jgi:glutathione S-transferase